ncbi:hypothetical protein scyTo_0019482, partial [Scyliorhinus torazame]|nr:hypothetical protein [Scyliorhinus torazame]
GLLAPETSHTTATVTKPQIRNYRRLNLSTVVEAKVDQRERWLIRTVKGMMLL